MDKDYDPNAGFRRLPLLPLPEKCPECSSSLGKGIKRKPLRSQWVLGMGLGLSILGTALAFWFWPQGATSLMVNGLPDLQNDTWFALGAPLMLGLLYFFRSEKIILLACPGCSWEKEFLDKNRKGFKKSAATWRQTQECTEKPTDSIIEISNNSDGIAWESEYSIYPKVCPECTRELIEPRARKPKLVSFLMGANTLYLLVALSAYGTVYESNWLGHLPNQTRNLMIILVGGLPLLSGVFYRRASRVLPFECFSCGWKKDFPLRENNAFDLPDDY